MASSPNFIRENNLISDVLTRGIFAIAQPEAVVMSTLLVHTIAVGVLHLLLMNIWHMHRHCFLLHSERPKHNLLSTYQRVRGFCHLPFLSLYLP